VLLLYNLIILVYFSAIRLASFFNPKAKLWVEGRKNLLVKIGADFSNSRKSGDRIVWMHCASLGEFEQGRPILEGLKKTRPGLKLLVTFFSPSGYEIRKNFPLADWVHYLPSDTKANVSRFLDAVNPCLALFVKYEYWYHYLTCLKNRNVPTLLVAGVFRPSQPFFQWYGKLHRQMLRCFTKLLVQDQNTAEVLRSIHTPPVMVTGDTRVDRVKAIVDENKRIGTVEAFCQKAPVVVCGSTWEADEEMLVKIIQNESFENWKFIFAPHDVSTKHISQLKDKLPVPYVIFTESESPGWLSNEPKVLLVDSIGILAYLYRYANIAYVGGAFGKGLHSILEPAAFGLPIVFGENFKKFAEAKHLVTQGGAFSVRNEKELASVMLDLQKEDFNKAASARTLSYITENRGASEKVLDVIHAIIDKE
jgi:3-deoxy-D-manno-octulosonic-acid transferase